jgi:thioredoxin 1
MIAASCRKQPCHPLTDLIRAKARTHRFNRRLFLEIHTMSDAIVHVTDASFEDEVLKSDVPVLVDFWAAWCGPCKMIAPILDEIAKEYEGKVKIAKVDVDANSDTPAKFGIRGIPTLMIFKAGAAAATKVGALSKTQLNDFIKTAL